MSKTYLSGYTIPDQRDEPPRYKEDELDALEAQLRAAHVAGYDELYDQLYEEIAALRRARDAWEPPY